MDTSTNVKETPTITVLIGRRIKKLRQENKMSQEQLALEAGIDRSYVGQIERFEKNVTVVTLQKIAKSLGLTLNEFLDFDKE